MRNSSLGAQTEGQPSPRRRDVLLILLALLFNLFTWLLLLANVRPSDQSVVLHYNTVFGIDRIGPWYALALIPGFGLFLIGLNALASRAFVSRTRPATLLLNISLIFLQLTLLASLLLVTLKNRA